MTCQPIKILIRNQLLEADISAETQPGFDIDNIITTWRSRFSRLNTANYPEILFSLKKTDVADSFYIKLAGKLPTVRLKLYSKINQTGALVYDSGIKYSSYFIPLGVWRSGLDGFGAKVGGSDDMVVHYFNETVIYRSGKIILNEISDNEQLDIHYATLGQSFQPSANFLPGAKFNNERPLNARRTRGGSLITAGNNTKWRVLSLSFDGMTTTDRLNLYNEIESNGGLGVFVNAYPENKDAGMERQNAFVADMQTGGYSHNGLNDHSTEIIFKEV